MAAEGINMKFLLELKERLSERESALKELVGFFASGADQVGWETDAERLGGMAAEVFQEVRKAVAGEEESRSRSAATEALSNLGIAMLNEINPKIAGFLWNKERGEKALAARRSGRQHCFGTVLVGVGKGGLPDDVHVIVISEMARARNRPEPEIIYDMQQLSLLLFAPNAFHQVTDAVTEGLRQGKLHLPVTQEQLPPGLAIPRKAKIGMPTIVQWVPQSPGSGDARTGEQAAPRKGED